IMFIVFFFQAEDGIRDRNVTGVQTCALPIFKKSKISFSYLTYLNRVRQKIVDKIKYYGFSYLTYLNRVRPCLLFNVSHLSFSYRSEERRVGKECRSRWWKND